MNRFARLLLAGLVFAALAASAWARGQGTTETAAAATATTRGKYGEAPMLTAMVTAGALPKVEDRLPVEPRVITPLSEIGKYGGTLRVFDPETNAWGDLQEAPARGPFLLAFNKDGSSSGDIAREVVFSADKKVMTFHLRPGMKWSDGAPLNADDMMFMYFDLHKEDRLATWGGLIDAAISMEKLDDYTIRVTWANPTPTAVISLADWPGSDWGALAPKHYLQQYHIKYNPDADKLATQKGFKTWVELMTWSLPYGGTQIDLSRPVLQPWFLKETSTTSKLFERNPYYHIVDTAGNQLPYVDRITTQVVDAETYTLKIIGGESDIAFSLTTLSNFPLYKENEKAGGYTVTLVPGPSACEPCLYFNPFHPDPVIGKLMNDVRFRQALSVAINRAEINELLFFGQAIPRQATVLQSASYFKQAWADAYAQYDPAMANRLLDQAGLTKKDANGIRIMSDGRPLSLTIEWNSPLNDKVLELVSEYWKDVGVDVQIKFMERGLWRTRREANQWDIEAEPHGGREIEMYAGGGSFNVSGLFVSPWAQWLAADTAIKAGTATLATYNGVMPGIEPPAEIKAQRAAHVEKATYGMENPQYRAAAAKAFEIQSQLLWLIGTVGGSPIPVIAKNNVGNVPKELPLWGSAPVTLNFFSNQLYIK
jgi:peptide/nickel transport system substrate-binding protein